MRNSLCHHHNMDGDLRGWILVDPLINCPACREAKCFTKEEVAAWVAEEERHEREGGWKVELPTCKLRIVETGDTWSNLSREYLVHLLEGEMPGQNELFELCGPHPFGGHTEEKKPGVTLVRCYLD